MSWVNMGVKMLLVVNYHYIRDKIPHTGIHPITPSFFKKQLELISTNGYKFVSVDDINKAIAVINGNVAGLERNINSVSTKLETLSNQVSKIKKK